MKKFWKISAAVLAFAIIIGIMWFANAFLGNPVSKALAKNAGKNYISEKYSDTDFVMKDVNYSFKTGDYYVRVKSPSSIDSHFSLSVSMLGEIKYDSYENDVLSGWNTYRRIDDEYRNIVDSAFGSNDFPLKDDLSYGTIRTVEDSEVDGFNNIRYGIDMGKLVLDKKYNVKSLAKTAGNITFYTEDEDISVKKASEILLTLKEYLDKNDIPFYTIDFVLHKPNAKEQINIREFLYKDIHKDGLTERVEKAHKTLTKYYDEQDAKKAK